MENSEPDLDDFLQKSFLNLDKIDENIYRSTYLWHPKYFRSVFGGQLIGQALVAAAQTVPESQFVHSLHCYFLQGGSSERPVLYHVDRTRDGKTYCSRTVKAVQRGKAVLTMQASFKKEESDPYRHQCKMPETVGPDNLLNTQELAKIALESEKLPEKRKAMLGMFIDEPMSMEFRPVDPMHLIRNRNQAPRRQIWIRACGHIGDNVNMHKCAAAYMSDLMLLDVALMSADKKASFNTTSLDHSMWFHNPFHANEWMLYEMESPHCGSGRALTLGRLWRPDGVLAMSVVQEGVVRTVKDSKL
ncbi:LOW QUALITY PROTEIN: acyl-coenzyme A thioesterase 8-like [Haliotis rubra]|uniref:LOW QUALITY PROTEIN: acyl-coenzyme A thioesterase 8-like n=1 Tax=Haliotis rubra TaxID=36100 RepID=UPI001EE57E62|nr:LOW QUALITY PROTEIN: acyl-coenzyme A thioesterase 8-like [Haliotis rubra]